MNNPPMWVVSILVTDPGFDIQTVPRMKAMTRAMEWSAN